MLIGIYTGATSHKVEVERPISGFLIKITRAAAVTNFPALPHHCTCFLSGNNQPNAWVVQQTTPLALLADFAQIGEGSILTDDDEKSVLIFIKLTPNGEAIDVQEKERIIFNITASATTDILAIYGLESANRTRMVYEYEQKQVAAGVGSGLFDLRTYNSIILPKSGFEGVELRVINAERRAISLNYTPVELDFLTLEANDIAVLRQNNADSITASVISPDAGNYILNLFNTSEMDLNTTTDAYKFYCVSQKLI